jgi:hypothetical protein
LGRCPESYTKSGNSLSDLTVLLYGPFGSGKTPSIGEAAEWVNASTSGAKHLRLYSADPGGLQTIRPHINLGLIKYIPIHSFNPWAYVQAIEGKLPQADGKWRLDEQENAKVGAWAFEGFTSIGNSLMHDLSQRTAAGEAIGGQGNIRFDGNSTVAKTTGADGIKIGGNNQAHFGVVQNHLRDFAFRSFRLPGLVIWTALERRAQDEGTMATVLGPELVGGALTSIAPSWFNLTLRLASIPGEGSKPAENRMYLQSHKDQTAPGAVALAGIRFPTTLISAEDQKKLFPPFIAPASFKRVLELTQGVEQLATEALAKQLGKKLS